MAAQDFTLIGSKFSKLTVIGVPYKSGKANRWHVECSCDCGKVCNIMCRLLTSGHTKSCGCLRVTAVKATGKSNAVHGKAHGTEWKTYYAMLDRCTKPEHKSFPRYGGRGITVCERWENSFENFLADMGDRPSGMTLDRIDNSKGYSPENCRWVTAKQQCNNRHNNVIIDAFGLSLTLAQWSVKTGVHQGTIAKRIKDGWIKEKALTASPTPRNRRKSIRQENS